MSGEAIVYVGAVAAPVVLAGGTYFFFKRFVRGRSTKGLLIAGNALVFLELAATLFLALESYYRFCYDETVGNNLTLSSRRWYRRHWQLNRKGVRDNVEYSNLKLGGRRRISFFGDSFTAGHGIKDVDDRFANRIRKAMPEWEVHVFAEVGWDTPQHLDVLNFLRARRYDLDVVVLDYLFNDITPFADGLEPIYEHTERRPKYVPFLFEHSYFLSLYFDRLKRWQAARGSTGNAYNQVMLRAHRGEAWENQAGFLKSFKQTAEDAGGTLLVVTFPEPGAVIRDGEELEEFRDLHARLAGFWRELNVPHLDLLPLFEQHRHEGLAVNRDDNHPSIHAHELTARAILGFLEQALNGTVADARPWPVEPPRTQPSEGGVPAETDVIE